jgi:hypothetical protein
MEVQGKLDLVAGGRCTPNQDNQAPEMTYTTVGPRDVKEFLDYAEKTKKENKGQYPTKNQKNFHDFSFSPDGVATPTVFSGSVISEAVGDARTLNGKLSAARPARGVADYKSPTINGKGVGGIIHQDLGQRLCGLKTVHLGLRLTIGRPKGKEKPIERYGYILDSCPTGNIGCNKPMVGAEAVVALCVSCFHNRNEFKPLLKCVVDYFLSDDIEPQMGLFEPSVSLDLGSMVGLNTMVSRLCQALENAKVEVRHTGDLSELRETLANVRVEHTVDTDGIGRALKGMELQIGPSVDITELMKNQMRKSLDELGVGWMDSHVFKVVINTLGIVGVLYSTYRYIQTHEWSYLFMSYFCGILCGLTDHVLISDIIGLYTKLKAKVRGSSDAVEEQMDTADTLSKVILGVMYSKVIAGMDGGFSLDDFVKQTASFKRYKDGTDFTFNTVLDIVQDGVTTACRMLQVEEIRIKTDPHPDYTDYVKRVRELVIDYEVKMGMDYALFNLVMSLLKEGDALKVKFERKQGVERITRGLDEAVHDLKKIKSRLQRFSITSCGPRHEPLGVLICGNTGVGKTTSSHDMMLAVLASIIDNEKDEERFLANHEDFIYNRVSEEEYFTGYHGQEIFYFDDIGATVDVAGQLNSPYMEAIRTINSNNYLMHMAALEDKGTTPFNSKIVWATTMREQFLKDLDSLWRDGSAFIRRWSPYWACPKKEFSTEETKELGPKRRMVDSQFLDPNDTEYSYLEFYEYNISTANLSGTPMSYRQTITNILAKYERKRAYGSQLLERNERTKAISIITKRVMRERQGMMETQMDDVQERIAKDVDDYMSAKAREMAKMKGRSQSLPATLNPSESWLYASMLSIWPGKSEEELTKLVRERLDDFTTCFDPEDTDASRERFQKKFDEFVFEIDEKKFRSRQSKSILDKMKGWSSWWLPEDTSKIKKIGIGLAALGSVASLLLLGRQYMKHEAKEDPVHAQSFTQRVQRPPKPKVRALKPKKYGKGHVQRISGRDYSVNEQISEEVLAIAPQLGMDKATQDVLTKVFMRAQYKVSCPGRSNGYGYMTLLDGAIGVMPMHFWVSWQATQEELGEEKLILHFNRYRCSEASKEVALEDIISYSPENMMERDLVFVVMPEYFNRGPNIRKHLLRDSEIPKDKFVGAVYLERDEVIQVLITTMHYRQTAAYTEYVLPDSFEYNVPTRFDGDIVSQDACRGPSTSTKDGNQPNCGYAARSRSVKPCERPLRSACGPELDVISVGWLLTVASDVSGEISSGLVPGGFSASSRRARHYRGGYAS